MTRDNYKHLVKYLISINKDLINKTALSNCHCIGLNSFIINEKPKIRLFVAEPNCELITDEIYLIGENPIPIHAHKYDDFFITLEGQVVQYLYKVCDDHRGSKFNKYEYRRLSDNSMQPVLIGEENLTINSIIHNHSELKADQLHTVGLRPTKDKCSWIIIETFEDNNFKQVAYHKDLKERDGLYIPIDNGYDYLTNYFN